MLQSHSKSHCPGSVSLAFRTNHVELWVVFREKAEGPLRYLEGEWLGGCWGGCRDSALGDHKITQRSLEGSVGGAGWGVQQLCHWNEAGDPNDKGCIAGGERATRGSPPKPSSLPQRISMLTRRMGVEAGSRGGVCVMCALFRTWEYSYASPHFHSSV